MRRTLWLTLLLARPLAAAEVGRYSSVAIGADGLALVSYQDQTSSALKVAHCSNVACTSARLSTLDSGGAHTSVAIGPDGRGLITYSAPGAFKAAHCSDLECTSAVTSTLVAAPPGAELRAGGLAIGADGRGLAPYLFFTTNPPVGTPTLYVSHCTDAPCTGVTTSTLAIGSFAVGSPVRGAVTLGSDGLGLLTYSHYSPPCCEYGVFVSHCQDATCSTRSSTRIADGNGAPSLAVGSDGLGLLVWSAQGSGLRSAHCADLACSSAATALLDGGAPLSDAAVARGADGLGLVAYAVAGDLKAAHCSDLACTTAALSVLDAAADVEHVHLAIGTDGLGLISYNDHTAGQLKVAHCQNVECSSATTGVVDGGRTDAYAVSPCRLLDTRASPPPLGANTARDFTAGGICGVAADARAVALNVTAVNPGDAGHLTVYAAGASLPLASALNFASGKTRANNVIVPLGADGRFAVRCDMPPGSTASVHLVIDVSAYFK